VSVVLTSTLSVVTPDTGTGCASDVGAGAASSKKIAEVMPSTSSWLRQ
jgi:hypothetical protein